MKITSDNQHTWFKTVDLQGARLNTVPDSLIQESKAVLIQGADRSSLFQDYEFLATRYGTALDYNNQNYFTVKGAEHQREIEYHTDGVSCTETYKIPKFLFFLVEDWPKNKGGAFKLSYIPDIIDTLSKEHLDILTSQQLQYFNYYAEHLNMEEDIVSFQKFALKEIAGTKILDMFLPIDEQTPDLRWKYKMKFEHLSQAKSLEVLNAVKEISKSKKCEHKFDFEKDDVLFVDNRFLFHGRVRFSEEINRCLHRIQILSRNKNYDLEAIEARQAT